MLDYLITNARIADGEGEREETALGIKNGRIAYLGASAASADAKVPARRTIDVGGAALVPGIIDIHAHSDSNPECAEKLLAQGVTTCLSGNCGLSPQLDFEVFRAQFEEQGYPLNQLSQVGHSSLRLAAGITDFYAAARPAQTEWMAARVERALDQGAAGLSLGLEYDPGASADEVLALARSAVRAAERAGRPPLVSVHARKVDRANDDSIKEALNISAATGARLVVSHLVYMWNGEGLRRTLDCIDQARARGLDVWADSGMWTAYCTSCGSAVFDEAEFIRKGYDFNKVRAASGKYAGQYLDLEKYREVRRDSPKDGFIYDPGTPDDIRAAFALNDVMVSTDAGPARVGQGHPQNAGTYPYFFRVFERGGVLSLTEALRRTSLLPARALGLNKGRVTLGADADLVVLDLPHLREKADFPGLGDPGAPPEGVVHVFVNGVLCITDGARVAGALAGRWL